MNFLFCAFVMLISSNVFAKNIRFVSPERWTEISIIANQFTRSSLVEGVTFKENESIPGPAWARRELAGPVIEFNPKIMATIPVSGQNIIFFHELAHIRLGHINKPYSKLSRDQKSEIEFEADIFAAYIFKKFEIVDESLLKFLDHMSGMTATVPSGLERAGIFREILLNQK